MEATLEMKKVMPAQLTWIGWLPLLLATLLALGFTGHVASWALMWIISTTLFAGFKWWTWWRAISRGTNAAAARSVIYLLFWPGMNARRFLSGNPPQAKAQIRAWLWAFTKILFGAGLLWGAARFAGQGLLAGWTGMVGFIFLLHFGLFALLALFWESRGIDAVPLMNCPIAATSLHDFWGKRWNAGFHDIMFAIIFTPLARRLGTTFAGLATFFVSGVLHELVITLPAGAGYGLPTFYFTLQGAAMLAERSALGLRLGLTPGWIGRAFAWSIVVLPMFALFPPSFVRNVMVPFLRVIGAL